MISRRLTINGVDYIYRPNVRRIIAADMFGLSTDAKPTVGVANSTIFFEMDSKAAYIFDEDNATWHPL